MTAEPVPEGTPWTDLGNGLAIRGVDVTGVRVDSARQRRGGADLVGATDVLTAAMSDVGMREADAVELVLGPGAPASGRRSDVGAAQFVELAVPPPPADHEQVVLAMSEDGVLTWHLHEPEARAGDRRGVVENARIYSIPVNAWDGTKDASRQGRRGLITAIGKKIIKVLVFPITDLILGPIEKFVALKWEQEHAPYGCRSFTPENYTGVQEPLTPDQWKELASGRALLFVHGTFSSAEGAFSRLPQETLRALHRRYGGRVFAFNHHTVGHDPKENVRRFCDAVPEVQLDLDIICHSRGGLVSRVLSTAADELGGRGRIRVSNIVFVGTPNGGTQLANAENMVKMLDRYTNLVQFLPDGPVEITIEVVLTAVKALASAGLKYLPGLAAQAPDSEFLTWLGQRDPGGTQHFALAADFEPSATQWKALVTQTVRDTVMDQVFEDAKNDLVVPTNGVGCPDGCLGFPIDGARMFSFPSDANVTHADFFANPTSTDKLLTWLDVPVGSPTS